MAMHGRANVEREEEENVERQDAGGTAHRTRKPQSKTNREPKPAKAPSAVAAVSLGVRGRRRGDRVERKPWPKEGEEERGWMERGGRGV